MPTVLLAGAFGQRNPGDEALLQAFLAAMPGWHAIATSRDPEGTAARHGCEAVSATDAGAVVTAVRHADAVVLAGGTVFKTLHPSTGRRPNELLRNAALLTWGARATSKPVAMIGVGAGSLSSWRARRLARRVVRQSDLLVLRDEDSARVLASTGAPTPFRVGADPTWTLLDGSRGDARMDGRDGGDAVIVTMSNLAGGGDLATRLADGLREVRDAGMRIALQPWEVHDGINDDLPLARSIAGRLGTPVEVLDPPRDIVEAAHQISRARLVIGMRFHSLVAAAAAGVRFVAVDHEPKLAALARRFDQPRMTPADRPARIAEAIGVACDAPPPPEPVARNQVMLAEEGFRLLRLVLEGGEAPAAEELTGLPLEPPVWEWA